MEQGSINAHLLAVSSLPDVVASLRGFPQATSFAKILLFPLANCSLSTKWSKDYLPCKALSDFPRKSQLCFSWYLLSSVHVSTTDLPCFRELCAPLLFPYCIVTSWRAEIACLPSFLLPVILINLASVWVGHSARPEGYRGHQARYDSCPHGAIMTTLTKCYFTL